MDEGSYSVSRFRAMNSDIELVCCRPDAERRLQLAQRWLAAFEDRFSRFRLLSEVSRLNAATGRPFRASPQLFGLTRLALNFAERSGGLFDPTVLRQLEAAGYDRSFETLASAPSARRTPAPAVSWRDVQLDTRTRSISLPAGSGLDFGGIGKGWAVDRLAAILGSPCLANGGGDVYLAGRPPGDDLWRVGVADPLRPDVDIATLALTDRGVATSSSVRRSWRNDGLLQHHLIDARTGRPSDSDAIQVTAIATSTVLADFHAKVTLLQGVEAGLAYLNREPDLEGLIVAKDGSRHESAGLQALLV